MTSVACPITDHRRAAIAALSVVSRSEHMEPAVLTPAVIAVARSISRAVSTAGQYPQ
jgi:DNA-binding IclR family transcriptional regulator